MDKLRGCGLRKGEGKCCSRLKGIKVPVLQTFSRLWHRIKSQRVLPGHGDKGLCPATPRVESGIAGGLHTHPRQ